MDETTANAREALIDRLDQLARETKTSPAEMEAAAREWAEYESWKEAMVQEALDDIEAGDEGRPAEEVFAEIRSILEERIRAAGR
jgi:predicted transcriptional regulator